MADRRPFIGGNWKMNLDGAEGRALVEALVEGIGTDCPADVVICPPFVYLETLGRLLRQADSPIKLGAQDVYPQPNGAYTGEVSVAQLQDVGVEVVLTGHSERRHVLGETDVLINAKTRAALDAGLEVILCVGEKIEERGDLLGRLLRIEPHHPDGCAVVEDDGQQHPVADQGQLDALVLTLVEEDAELVLAEESGHLLGGGEGAGHQGRHALLVEMLGSLAALGDHVPLGVDEEHVGCLGQFQQFFYDAVDLVDVLGVVNQAPSSQLFAGIHLRSLRLDAGLARRPRASAS